MTTPTYPEIHIMVIVDCPLCEGPTALDAEAVELDCPDCGVRIPLADDPATLPLPAAA